MIRANNFDEENITIAQLENGLNFPKLGILELLTYVDIKEALQKAIQI